MVSCRCTFTLVCLIAIVGGTSLVALQIVSASTKAWVFVGVSHSTFSFGLFSVQDTAGLMTLKLNRNTALVTMQAMLIFAIGFGSAAVILTLLGILQRPICDRGTQFYVRLAEIFFAVSAILYLIGIAIFTHLWIKDASSFFKPRQSIGVTYTYGYAYVLAWFTCLLQVALACFIICTINIVIRRQDRMLVEEDEYPSEKRKLLTSSFAKGDGQSSSDASSSKPQSVSPSGLTGTQGTVAEAEKSEAGASSTENVKPPVNKNIESPAGESIQKE